MKGDDEKQHAMEDTLYQEVSDAIVDETTEDAQKCAEKALKTLDLNFVGWAHQHKTLIL